VPKPEIKQEEFAASDGEENEVILISDVSLMSSVWTLVNLFSIVSVVKCFVLVLYYSQTPIKSIVTHTPPRESGLTPSFKRNRYGEGAIPRQPHADNAGASAALVRVFPFAHK